MLQGNRGVTLSTFFLSFFSERCTCCTSFACIIITTSDVALKRRFPRRIFSSSRAGVGTCNKRKPQKSFPRTANRGRGVDVERNRRKKTFERLRDTREPRLLHRQRGNYDLTPWRKKTRMIKGRLCWLDVKKGPERK